MDVIKKLSVVFLVCISFLAQAQNEKSTSEQSVSMAELFKSERGILENRFIDERQMLERQADRQYTQLKDSFDWTLKCIGILLTVAGGLFIYFFGKSKKEIREAVDEITKKQVAHLVEQNIIPIREKLSLLQDEVAQLIDFQKRKVVWIADPKEDMESILSAFSLVGLTNVSVITPDDSQSLNLGECDLVILSFDNSFRAKELLKAAVNRLKEFNIPIHLVVYTYSRGVIPVRVDEEEAKSLVELKWYSMANFPSTMIAQVVSLVRGSIAPIRGKNG